MDLDSLQEQLAAYEKGDYEALNQMLDETTASLTETNRTTKMGNIDPDDFMIPTDGSTLTDLTVRKSLDGESTLTINNDDATESDLTSTIDGENPLELTQEKITDINNNTRKLIKLNHTLEKINDIRREVLRDRKKVEEQVKDDIERYGLKEITKGNHQLYTKHYKGRKKNYNRSIIKTKIKDFLQTMDIVEEGQVDELHQQMVNYIDNSIERRPNKVKLIHDKL